MFDTIILLAGPAEQSVFPAVLRAHNPDLTVLSSALRMISPHSAPISRAVAADCLRDPEIVSTIRWPRSATARSTFIPVRLISRMGAGAFRAL